jgi:hypothetical protein
MARRRRPSIPLIVLFVILLLLFLLAGTIFQLALDMTGEGHITYEYQQGSSPIVSITFGLPQDLAEAMDPELVTGWTVNLANNALTLTDGTLTQGQSITVDYKLTKYITSGTKQITATATTESGGKITTQRPLEVDTVVLGLVWTFYQNAIWLLILAIIVLAVIIVLFVKGKKEDEKEQQPQ